MNLFNRQENALCCSFCSNRTDENQFKKRIKETVTIDARRTGKVKKRTKIKREKNEQTENKKTLQTYVFFKCDLRRMRDGEQKSEGEKFYENNETMPF